MDVREAIVGGRSYTQPVPFKLSALPRTSDGMLKPAPVHFTGRLVAILCPFGRSQVDQWAAMFIDNELGHSIGMAKAAAATPGGGARYCAETMEHRSRVSPGASGTPCVRTARWSRETPRSRWRACP